MYLHTGNRRAVRTRDLIGIFDMDTATVSPCTRRYLSVRERAGEVSYPAGELPRSFLLCRKDGEGTFVLLSRFSARTLRGAAVPVYGRTHGEREPGTQM